MKTTIRAYTDVALVKYWGKKDAELRIPENDSISLKLESLFSTTTVQWDRALTADEVIISGEQAQGRIYDRVTKQLDRVRDLANSTFHATVVSENSFPKSTGLSSSGSGMAALTVAATSALGLEMSEKELSRLARMASGSAARCVCSGWVRWQAGSSDIDSYAYSLQPQDYWGVVDVVALVSRDVKKISSTDGHETARTSIIFEERMKRIGDKLHTVEKLIEKRNFEDLGEVMETEALEFHSLLMTSRPPLYLWMPGTLAVMGEVGEMREAGLLAYFTMNTGYNVHVLTLPEFAEEVEVRLRNLDLVEDVLVSGVGGGYEVLDNHLV